MKLTKLEKHLLLKMCFTLLKWLFCIIIIVYTIYRMFLLATLVTLLWLVFTSFSCCENGYIPRYHYFFHYFFSHTLEERSELSNQYEAYNYIKIGECVFLEDCLLLTDFGVLLWYSEIKSIVYQKVGNLNVVYIILANEKRYAFNISESEYKGTTSLYCKALTYFERKKFV